MTKTEELPGFEDRLRVELRRVVSGQTATTALEPDSLVRHPGRAPWRRRAVLVPVAAVATLIMVLGLTFVAGDGSPSRAYAIESLPDGRIHVTVSATFAEGHDLEAALRQAGVDVAVNVLTAHPTLVGTIEFPAHALPPEGLERGTGEFWIDPAKFSGAVEMLVYIAAAPGEDWNQAPSVFHPDEPLGGLPCAIPGPLDSATLERYARSVGITEFSWEVIEGDPSALTWHVVRTTTRPDGEVVHAELGAPGKLRVGVRPQDVVERFGHGGSPSMNLNVHESPEPVCTPELAGRWTNS